eukprot:6197768-Pleurochrysis_carterae.AAC.1
MAPNVTPLAKEQGEQQGVLLANLAVNGSLNIAGNTATGYRAVRSGVQGRPIKTTHAFVWRVSTYLYFTGSTSGSNRPEIGRENDY